MEAAMTNYEPAAPMSAKQLKNLDLSELVTRMDQVRYNAEVETYGQEMMDHPCLSG